MVFRLVNEKVKDLISSRKHCKGFELLVTSTFSVLRVNLDGYMNLYSDNNRLLPLPCVSNEAKGWISKRVFQENKARQIHFFPRDMHLYVCISGGRKCSFLGRFGAICFLEAPVLRFAPLPSFGRFVGA